MGYKKIHQENSHTENSHTEGYIPGGSFLVGREDFQGGSLMDGNFPGGNFAGWGKGFSQNNVPSRFSITDDFYPFSFSFFFHELATLI